MLIVRWRTATLFFLGAPGICFATPTGDFISRWRSATHAIEVKGASATPEDAARSPEISALFGEFAEAAQAYRTQIIDARAKKLTPRSCPPKGVDLTIDSMISDIDQLPPDLKQRPFKESFAAVMDRRYPCHPGRPQ